MTDNTNDDEPQGGGTISRLHTGKPQAPWREGLIEYNDGGVKATLYNVVKILLEHPDWRGVLQYNAFANRINKTRPPPYGEAAGEFVDVDALEVACWLGSPSNLPLNVSSALVSEAALVAASRNGCHPVTAYLDRLTWDQIERLPYLFPDFFGADRNDYTAAVGLSFMISAVARVRRPGCKVDTMVILEGGQGIGKSTAIRELCGAEWFAEMLESPQNKDFYQLLPGRWIVEIAELQAFSKADRNRIKQAITAQEDTYRPSYGHHAQQFPRQCIFVGSTNDDAYLKDETGARRFLPVRCTEVNLQALIQLRDQLWAEADARFHRGETWWEFPESAAEEQDARYDADVWEEPIMAWLNGECEPERYPPEVGIPTQAKPVQRATIHQIMRHALHIDVSRHTKPDQMRVGGILRHNRWERGRTRVNGKRGYWYFRPK